MERGTSEGTRTHRAVSLEEGTLSGWPYEVLEPHVEELVVPVSP